MPLDPIRRPLTRLWRAEAPLTATAVAMAVALVFTLAGLWLDPRTVAGAPVWLKPAKFAVSIAIYCLTLAWIFTRLPDWPRLRRRVGRFSAAVFVLEFAIISLQASRGVGSHFNVATVFDGVLFSIMGTAIVLQTLASVVVLVALWRQPFDEASLGWSLRLGLLITILAAFSGGLMTRPTAAQLDAVRSTGRMAIAGAHTVGAPDGGPGVPGTGWSTTHGDLRVAHFAGLHAIQVLPLVAIGVGRLTRRHDTAARLTIVAAASYGSLFLVVLWQALRGQSIAAPDATTLTALATWLLLSASAAWLVSRSGR